MTHEIEESLEMESVFLWPHELGELIFRKSFFKNMKCPWPQKMDFFCSRLTIEVIKNDSTFLGLFLNFYLSCTLHFRSWFLHMIFPLCLPKIGPFWNRFYSQNTPQMDRKVAQSYAFLTKTDIAHYSKHHLLLLKIRFCPQKPILHFWGSIEIANREIKIAPKWKFSNSFHVNGSICFILSP